DSADGVGTTGLTGGNRLQDRAQKFVQFTRPGLDPADLLEKLVDQGRVMDEGCDQGALARRQPGTEHGPDQALRGCQPAGPGRAPLPGCAAGYGTEMSLEPLAHFALVMAANLVIADCPHHLLHRALQGGTALRSLHGASGDLVRP